MTFDQPPLWPDDWAEEADARAAGDLHTARAWPLLEHGRSCSRPQVPMYRRIVNVPTGGLL